MAQFHLHPQLAADTFDVTCLSLCRVLLMNDTAYPWLILVPERDAVREVHELTPGDQQQLMAEITRASRCLQRLVKADKMNVAALGNMVPQLHIHVIARFHHDPAWPAPVWGRQEAMPYSEQDAGGLIGQLEEALAR